MQNEQILGKHGADTWELLLLLLHQPMEVFLNIQIQMQSEKKKFLNLKIFKFEAKDVIYHIPMVVAVSKHGRRFV